jgi:hypothetical protein
MFSLIGNVIVLNIFGRDLKIESDMPKWVNFFAFFFCLFFNFKKYSIKRWKNLFFAI